MPRSSFSSIDSGTAAMPSKFRNLVNGPKLDIKISLNNKKKTYTTLDKIDGTVSITPAVDTSFDSVEIEFVGTARTYVERLTTAAAISGRAEAFHQFLKLTQPGLGRRGPQDGIMKAGVKYDYDFVFVVPQQLLLRVCQHKVHSPVVRDAHLQLPPTFGDRDGAGRADGIDDIAPEMTSIRYGVFAKVSKVKLTAGDEPSLVSVGSKARKIRVIPASEELPPLDVNEQDTEYTIRKEKTLRKGVLKGKLGGMVMEAAQPSSIRLKSPNSDNESPASTMATVMLRFDPTEANCTPPKLGNMSNKIRIHTFFGSTARQNFPSKNGALLDLSQGMHTEQVSLSSRNMANADWTKHDPTKSETMQRRDSACSVAHSEIPAASAHYKSGPFYTTRLLVPITLPTNKTFVPTFHSCLITRNYTVKLELGLPAGMGGNMELKLPIQISSQGNDGDASPGRRESIAPGMEEDIHESAGRDSSDFFEPRMLHVPEVDYIGQSSLGGQPPIGNDLPPGYTPYVVPGNGDQHRRMSLPLY